MRLFQEPVHSEPSQGSPMSNKVYDLWKSETSTNLLNWTRTLLCPPRSQISSNTTLPGICGFRTRLQPSRFWIYRNQMLPIIFLFRTRSKLFCVLQRNRFSAIQFFHESAQSESDQNFPMSTKVTDQQQSDFSKNLVIQNQTQALPCSPRYQNSRNKTLPGVGSFRSRSTSRASLIPEQSPLPAPASLR